MLTQPLSEPPEYRDLAHSPEGESQNTLRRGLLMELDFLNVSMLP